MQSLIAAVERIDPLSVSGRVAAVNGLLIEARGGLTRLSIGARADIVRSRAEPLPAEVVGFRDTRALLMPFGPVEGVAPGAEIRIRPQGSAVRPTLAWRGRIVDAFGEPIDGKGPLPQGPAAYPLRTSPPAAHARGRVGERLDLGVRAMDVFTTCCRGQRLGVFAGSGVGKSVLLSMLARNAQCDAVVVGLIGERGREVREFIEETLGDSQQFMPGDFWTELKGRLLDKPEQRLRRMDKAGIELSLYSLNAPAIQALQDPGQALEIARRANDALAAEVARHPGRLAGLAALPMQDPEAAIAELTRCVKELGFVGALVNGFSQAGAPDTALYYDLPQYRPFWRACEQLGVPFYLHPRNPLPNDIRAYDGHNWLLGPNWAFHAETAVHALRLIGSGLFDECPNLQIVLGHLGEGIPVYIWRIDGRNGWMKERHRYAAKHGVGHYFRKHFHLTTSGNFSTPALLNAVSEMGADRVMFSVDWPFESVEEGCVWFDRAEIGAIERAKIGRDNAIKLFKLKLN